MEVANRRSNGLWLALGVRWDFGDRALQHSLVLGLGIPEDTLVHLWTLERKLMQLLHADSTGSPTSFLDACGGMGNRDHRLLLSNFDIGTFLSPGAIQLGLNFADKKSTPELFSAPEMGEDAIAVLRQYLPLHQQILQDIRQEGPVLQAALRHYPTARQQAPKGQV